MSELSSKDIAEIYLASLLEQQKVELKYVQHFYGLTDGRVQQIFADLLEEYEELISCIAEEDNKQFQFLFGMLLLGLQRISMKEQACYLIDTYVDEEELIRKLKSFHRLTKGLHEDSLSEPLRSLPIIEQIRQEEQKKYWRQLQELTLTIRTKGWQSYGSPDVNLLEEKAQDGDKEPSLHSNTNNVSGVQKALDDHLHEDKEEILITFPQAAQEELELKLVPYVEQKSKDLLRTLMSGEAVTRRIYFSGSLSQLTAIFKELKKDKLYVYKKAIDMGRWLENYFCYYDQFAKRYVDVKERSATRALRTGASQHRELKK